MHDMEQFHFKILVEYESSERRLNLKQHKGEEEMLTGVKAFEIFRRH